MFNLIDSPLRLRLFVGGCCLLFGFGIFLFLFALDCLAFLTELKDRLTFVIDALGVFADLTIFNLNISLVEIVRIPIKDGELMTLILDVIRLPDWTYWYQTEHSVVRRRLLDHRVTVVVAYVIGWREP